MKRAALHKPLGDQLGKQDLEKRTAYATEWQGDLL
jgi:hypothetical protein